MARFLSSIVAFSLAAVCPYARSEWAGVQQVRLVDVRPSGVGARELAVKNAWINGFGETIGFPSILSGDPEVFDFMPVFLSEQDGAVGDFFAYDLALARRLHFDDSVKPYLFFLSHDQPLRRRLSNVFAQTSLRGIWEASQRPERMLRTYSEKAAGYNAFSARFFDALDCVVEGMRTVGDMIDLALLAYEDACCEEGVAVSLVLSFSRNGAAFVLGAEGMALSDLEGIRHFLGAAPEGAGLSIALYYSRGHGARLGDILEPAKEVILGGVQARDGRITLGTALSDVYNPLVNEKHQVRLKVWVHDDDMSRYEIQNYAMPSYDMPMNFYLADRAFHAR